MVDLFGRWRTACLSKQERGSTIRMEHVFTERENYAQVTYYRDDLCEESVFSFRAIMTYKLRYSNEAFLLNKTLDSFWLIPLNQEVAERLNVSEFCDLSSWKLGVPGELTGKECTLTGFPKKGTQIFDTAEIEESSSGNVLFLTKDPSTFEESRSTEVDKSVPFYFVSE